MTFPCSSNPPIPFFLLTATNICSISSDNLGSPQPPIFTRALPWPPNSVHASSTLRPTWPSLQDVLNRPMRLAPKPTKFGSLRQVHAPDLSGGVRTRGDDRFGTMEVSPSVMMPGRGMRTVLRWILLGRGGGEDGGCGDREG